MIRNKTYRNFIIIKNKLMKEKGYSPEEATKLSHLVFENVFYDKDCGNRSAEYFYNRILSAKYYANEYSDHQNKDTHIDNISSFVI